MNIYEISGFYGSGKNKAKVFVYEFASGAKYYVVSGGYTVNKTYDNISNGTNVEYLKDIDCFTSIKPINTLPQFIKAVES